MEITKRIKSLGESGRAREAVSELAQMARLGVQPDTQAGTALLHACVRNGQIDMAQTVFEELFGRCLLAAAVDLQSMLESLADHSSTGHRNVSSARRHHVQHFAKRLWALRPSSLGGHQQPAAYHGPEI